MPSPRKLLYLANEGRPSATAFYRAAVLAAQQAGLSVHLAFHMQGEDRQALEQDIKGLEDRLGLVFHQIPFRRNPLHPGNLGAFKQLKALMQQEQFDLIHCNTPVGGMAGRLLGQKLGIRPVIYQAHGFHFYKGSGLLSWLVYYPIEKWLARKSDFLLTINREDLLLAQQRLRLRSGRLAQYIPGVGVDLSDDLADPHLKANFRASLGLEQDAGLLISVGELNANKNHRLLIEALASLPGLHLCIAGKGPQEAALKELASSLKVESRVHFLGFRSDLASIYPACDLFCLASLREGLSTAIMEAMAQGLPVVASDIRGNQDLVQEEGGRLVQPGDVDGFVAAIQKIMAEPGLRQAMGRFNREQVQQFGFLKVVSALEAVYRAALWDGASSTRGGQ